MGRSCKSRCKNFVPTSPLSSCHILFDKWIPRNPRLHDIEALEKLLAWTEDERPVCFISTVFIDHVGEAEFELRIEHFLLLSIDEGPVLFVIVHVAVIEDLIVLSVKINLILCAIRHAQLCQ